MTSLDQYLDEICPILAEKLPDLKAIYLGGSYAHGYAIPTSDLDLSLFLDRDIEPKEHEMFYENYAAFIEDIQGQWPLDLGLYSIPQLRKSCSFDLERDYKKVWGKDLVFPKPILELKAYKGMHGGFNRMKWTRKEGGIRFPLAYPDPASELKGYDWRTLTLGDQEEKSIKEIVVLTGWMATGLIRWIGGEDVPTKKDCPVLFRRLIGGEAADHFTAITQLCREKLHYKVPTDPVELSELKGLLPRVLDFENFYMKNYLRFLRENLENEDPDRAEECKKRLGEIEIVEPNLGGGI